MDRTIVDISQSLDGYVAGPGISPEAPFGTAGQRLTSWSGSGDGEPSSAIDKEAAERMFANTGAIVIGRTLFDVGIGLWGEDGTWGRPVYVVTSRPGDDLVKGPTRFTFVGGVEAAVRQARQTAGEQDVVIAGGASVVQQALAAGLVDELRLHVVPVLIGGGTALFDGIGDTTLESVGAVASPHAAHLTYRVDR